MRDLVLVGPVICQRIDDIFHRKFCTTWLKGQAAPPRLRLAR